MTKHVIAALAAFAVFSATIVPAAAANDRVRRKCGASGDGDISMSAKYEKRDGRWLFTFRALKRTHVRTSPGATPIGAAQDRG